MPELCGISLGAPPAVESKINLYLSRVRFHTVACVDWAHGSGNSVASRNGHDSPFIDVCGRRGCDGYVTVGEQLAEGRCG